MISYYNDYYIHKHANFSLPLSLFDPKLICIFLWMYCYSTMGTVHVACVSLCVDGLIKAGISSVKNPSNLLYLNIVFG